MARETLLLTGASGLLGAALSRRLGRRADLIALEHTERVAPVKVRGDLTAESLGLSRSNARELRETITGILHAGGSTDFSISRADAERINVHGTANLLEFARGCPRLEKVMVLSTTYVAGKREGRILESELTHRAGFVNEYERSKYRMEMLVRRAMRTLPVSVVRLSTIVGSSRGEIARYGAVHHALRLYYNGLVPMVPGEKESPVDLIAIDDAVRAIERLFRDFAAGRTYHIAAADGAMPLEEFLRVTGELFQARGNGWRSRGVEIPPIVPLRTFRLLESTARQTGDVFLQQVMSTMATFAPQLSYPKHFDTTSIDRLGLRPRPFVDYYDRVIRFAIRRGWK